MHRIKIVRFKLNFMENGSLRERKAAIVHPILFACFPVLFLLSINSGELTAQDALVPILISAAIGFVFWISLRVFLGGKKAGLIASLFILLFVIYGNIHNILQSNSSDISQFIGSNLVLGPIFLVIGILGIIFFKKTRASSELNSIFNIIAIAMIAVLITTLMFSYSTNWNDVDSILSNFVEEPIIINDVEKKPDVFVIIVDEFAGEKQAKIDFNYDLTPYYNKLEDRGFLMPDVSWANYPHSFLSFASTLNMGYLDELVEDVDPNSKDFQLFIRYTDQNKVFRIFDSYGYKVSVVGSSIGYGGVPDEYLCAYGDRVFELRKNLVMTYLPVTIFNEELLSKFHRDKLECSFAYIENYESVGEQPHFVHTLLLLPHGPYIYDSEGNDAKRDPNLKPDKEGYFGQLQFAEKKSLELIDSIQKRSPESVIIIYSDHGYRDEIDQANPTDEDFVKAFNVLTAVYFPDKDIEIPEKLSLVNLYRIFFNTYFDTDYEILEDRHIWYNNIIPQPYVHIDITDKLNSLT